MEFGKNRVQYTDFYWQHYDFGSYKTYYHIGGDRTARYVGLRARQLIAEMEYRLDVQINNEIIFIVYNDLLDFRQSNIGLVSGNDEHNIGGVTTISNNKILVYFNGDHAYIDEQIRKSVAEILINKLLTGSTLTDRLLNTTLKAYPEWFVKGLVSYYGSEFDATQQQIIKDGILNGKLTKLQWLTDMDAELGGNSFWNYLAMNYGESSLKDVVYLTRITKNVTNAFAMVTGNSFKNLVAEWSEYTKYRLQSENPDTVSVRYKKSWIKTRKNIQYRNIEFDHHEKYAAYNTHQNGKVKIYLHHVEQNKREQIFKYGYQLPQIEDNQYPIIRWFPDQHVLTWIYENKQQIKFCIYNVETSEISHRNILYVNRILDYNFKSDGSQIVFSGVKNGQTDLFFLELASNNQTQLTNDLPDDINPCFSNDNHIIFSTNRSQLRPDTLQPNYDIYTTPTSKFKPEKIVVEAGNQTMPIPILKNTYLYLSDQSGIRNRFYARHDSIIKFIDTTIHYRYFTESHPTANLPYGLLSHSQISKNRIADISLFKQKNTIQIKTINTNRKNQTPIITEQKAFLDARRTFYNQQLTRIAKQANDTLIDINNYIFEYEKNIGKQKKSWPQFEHDSLWVLKRKLYVTTFYTNSLANQVDFSQLNQSYQTYTGGAVYFNPGFNILTKFGVADLFENYKVTAGVRLAANFTGNEYLLSIEYVKKRWDKQLILHRVGAEELTSDDNLIRSYSYQALFVLKYPFNQVASVRLTAKTRTDQIVFPAVDNTTLVKPNKYRLWAGSMAEFVYDNTKTLGLNLYTGTRGKIFFEHYSGISQNNNKNLFVVGTDIRNYIKIHRQLILANRFAASSSFGNALLIYYLGGVDNWMSLSGRSYFDPSIPVDRSKNWAFQTVATNMRGFQQNIRNGNSFAVLNSEIRWPVIRYLLNRPLNSNLLNNFMVTGFFDLGSAWYGWDITNKHNFYRYDYIENGPVSVRIDRHRDPLVAGYGFGLRTRLFGYYLRFDWAWGIENMRILDRVFYFSINIDF